MLFRSLKAGAIDKESLLDLIEPPMKQLLKDRLRVMEAKQQQQAQAQQKEAPKSEGKPELRKVG